MNTAITVVENLLVFVAMGAVPALAMWGAYRWLDKLGGQTNKDRNRGEGRTRHYLN